MLEIIDAGVMIGDEDFTQRSGVSQMKMQIFLLSRDEGHD